MYSIEWCGLYWIFLHFLFFYCKHMLWLDMEAQISLLWHSQIRQAEALPLEGLTLGHLRISSGKNKKQRHTENESECVCMGVFSCGQRAKGERHESDRQQRVWEIDRETSKGRSGDGGSIQISEQWFSLRSGYGGQSLAIDLFKIQSSAINKLGVLKSLSASLVSSNPCQS